MSDRLFTPRFLTMFGFSVTVFFTVFQLLPTAPYHVLDLGGSTAVSGLFHGLLTFSSAASAPFVGPLSDRLGHRRVLIVTSVVLAMLSASYALIVSVPLLLTVVVFHGVIWSALLSASGAYMTATIPAGRRGEGLGYWGLASVIALGTAPAVGFVVLEYGWTILCLELCALNLLMAVIAWRLPGDDVVPTVPVPAAPPAARAGPHRGAGSRVAAFVRSHVEWRVVLLSVTTAVVSFAYGGLTSFSALFADDLGLSPRSRFLTVMAVATALGRLVFGRTLDALGPRRVLVRCLVLPPIGLLLLVLTQGELLLMTAAVVFGVGFSLMLPAYNAYVLEHVPAGRRGAAFGAMLAAFDTGIGSGASVMGWLIQGWGFRVAFAAAAVLASVSLPYFLVAERRLGFAAPPAPSAPGDPQ